jgi:hypothetical protein
MSAPTWTETLRAAAGGRRLTRAATNSPAAAHTKQTKDAAMTSDGRCHLPRTNATPPRAAAADTPIATVERQADGATMTAASAIESATVVCPLGRLFGPGARSRRVNKVILENLGREVRATDNDRGTQREFKPATKHGERHTDQQRETDGPD